MWIRRAPCWAAASATASAPKLCTDSKRWRPRSNRMPTRLMTTSASRVAAATEAAWRILACTAWICPTRPSAGDGRRAPAGARDPDAVMLLGERPDHMLADESRAAEDGDQHVGVGLDGHAALTARARACKGGRASQIQDEPGPV